MTGEGVIVSTSIIRLISYAGWLGLLAVQLNLVGCSNDPDTFRANNLSSRQRELVQQAALAWCSRSDGRACPMLGDGSSDVYTTPENGAYYGVRYGRSDGESDIFIVENLDDDLFYTTAAHEFGHHFGCRDYWDPSAHAGVMAVPVEIYTAGDVEVISADDLACVK